MHVFVRRNISQDCQGDYIWPILYNHSEQRNWFRYRHSRQLCVLLQDDVVDRCFNKFQVDKTIEKAICDYITFQTTFVPIMNAVIIPQSQKQVISVTFSMDLKKMTKLFDFQ